jgi:hypothetical protein
MQATVGNPPETKIKCEEVEEVETTQLHASLAQFEIMLP